MVEFGFDELVPEPYRRDQPAQRLLHSRNSPEKHYWNWDYITTHRKFPILCAP